MIPGVLWPPLPADELGILNALRATEGLTRSEVEAGQLSQLRVLADYARTQTAWGSRHLPELLTWDTFRALPIIDRVYVQSNQAELLAASAPAEHGSWYQAVTSGSTGTPVRVWKTGLVAAIWQAVTARDHQWHGRDLNLNLSAIRRAPNAPYPGEYCESWGYAAELLGGRGQCWLLDIGVPVHEQISWLDEHHEFAYLLTFPSNLAELLRLCADRGHRWAGLRQVRTLSEPVTEELRVRCREILGVEIVDLYSMQELGYIALQRPDGVGYYAMADTHVVEVLSETGNPCQPGEIGRVVVTPLHNFAMPLFRYDVGDLALVGEPGPLPYLVIERIFGRTRNLLLKADGARVWLSLGADKLMELAPLVRYQFIQVAVDRICVRLVVRRALSDAEEQAMREHLEARTPGEIDFEFSYVDDIPRSAGGKFEDFICAVS